VVVAVLRLTAGFEVCAPTSVDPTANQQIVAQKTRSGKDRLMELFLENVGTTGPISVSDGRLDNEPCESIHLKISGFGWSFRWPNGEI
jgi:hypothetical protein